MSDNRGHFKIDGDTTVWRNIGATQRPDGSWALQVDTELVLDSGDISIANIKVGSTNQTTASLRYLKTLDDGTVVVTNINVDPFLGYKGARAVDSGAFPHYFGLVNDVEDWIIIEESRSGNESTFLYAIGSGAFATNWGNRATTVVYDEYFNVF